VYESESRPQKSDMTFFHTGRGEWRLGGTQGIDRADWRTVLLASPCAYCGAPSTQVDHIDPSSAGGIDDASNMVGACGSCNASKCATPLLEFMLGRAVAAAASRAWHAARVAADPALHREMVEAGVRIHARAEEIRALVAAGVPIVEARRRVLPAAMLAAIAQR